MLIVGLTGGIGSGKTTVAKMFEELGVPVYIADLEAKKLMQTSPEIKVALINLLGAQAYTEEGLLNRTYIASQVFNNKTKLAALNTIVHPQVGAHFKQWVIKQERSYVIKEAAILFENGGHTQCDKTILVTAPVATRISRVLNRDKTAKKDVMARMENQWPDSKKIPLADYCIQNIDLEHTRLQVKNIHNALSSIKNR